MLDYAANGVAYWPIEQIQVKWEAGRDSETVEGELAELLQGEQTPEQFWDAVKTNLQAGKVRMVFLADLIPPELLRIVQFMNEQMDPAEVLALEVRQFAGEGHTTLVPRVVGQRIKPSVNPAKMWDEAGLMAEIERNDPLLVQPARKILDWAKSKLPLLDWGRGTQYGSFTPWILWKGTRHQIFKVWTNGYVQVEFGHLARKPAFADTAMRLELMRRLNEIPSITLSAEDADRFPSIKLSSLTDAAALVQFLSAVEWALEKIKAQ